MYLLTRCSYDTPSLTESQTPLLSITQDGEAVVEVHVPGGDQQEMLLRKRTTGVLDMGGVSTQIAYEVPKTVSFASPQQVIIHNQFCFHALWFLPLTLCFSPPLPFFHPLSFPGKTCMIYSPFITIDSTVSQLQAQQICH